MKIGMTADRFRQQGYGQWKDALYLRLKEQGYSCSNFGMSDTDSILYTCDEDTALGFLTEERRLAEVAGVEIVQVHGPWRYPPRDLTEEDRAERMEKMKRSIRMTAMLGCKNWVVHPIMPYGVQERDCPEAALTWDLNLSFMRELLDTAKDCDVTICFENMPFKNFSLSTPSDILRFVKAIDDEHFKICFDTGHVNVFGHISVADAVRELGNEIRVLHVHDNKYGEDMHLWPQFGTIDWSAFEQALRDIGYDGCFMLETAPPSHLSEQLFSEMSVALYHIADEIANV